MLRCVSKLLKLSESWSIRHSMAALKSSDARAAQGPVRLRLLAAASRLLPLMIPSRAVT